MVHCSLRNCFVCRFGEQCVEPSPAQTLLQTLYRTPRTLTKGALSELHPNLTTFPATTLPEPPRNFPTFCWGRTCFRKMRRDRFRNILFMNKICNLKCRGGIKSCGHAVSWWTQATGRYTQRREWRKRSRAFVSCGPENRTLNDTKALDI